MSRLTQLWIIGSAVCVCCGWILSAIRQVNIGGYSACFLLLGAGLWLGRKSVWPLSVGDFGCALRRFWRRRRRFRKAYPLLFALTAALAFIGGAIYAPSNFDGLNYRLPRILSWWDRSGWHWINGPDVLKNASGTVYEWLMMPLLIFTHSDRLFFLINATGYLLLPGLVFGVLRRAGAAGRVAWVWMWLLPMGFCYVMEAGSIGNDLVGVIYALAATHCALEARITGRVEFLWLAFAAAGLTTGVKAPDLLLLLPIACAIWPALGLLRARPAGTLLVVAVSLLISFFPTAVLNQRYAGNWTGDPLNAAGASVKGPLAGIVGNGLLLVAQTAMPPFVPLARPLGDWLWRQAPENFPRWVGTNFPRFSFRLSELPIEEYAGLGLILAVLMAAAVIVDLRKRGRAGANNDTARRHSNLIGAAAFVALLVYMCKIGSEMPGRLLCAYYPFLLLPFLPDHAQQRLVGKQWFKWGALLVGAGSLAAVVLTPARPLWPAKMVLARWAAEYPDNKQIQRAKSVYDIYSIRSDALASLREQIPASVKTVGFIGGPSDLETSMWRPYGHRRVVHIVDDKGFDRPQTEWVIAKNTWIELTEGGSFDQWVRRTGGKVAFQTPITIKVSVGPELWSLVHYPVLARSRD